MKQRICDFLIKYNVSNVRIVVALSGGPDSVALLSILSEIRQEFKISLEAAYVNHSIRSVEENLKDKVLIENLCSSLSIKLHVKELPQNYIYKRSKTQKRSLESVAREERYSFFNTLVKDNDYIALGHNLDDSLETITMRFFGGSTIAGLKGIEPVVNNIIRPLSLIEKWEVLEYLKEKKIKFNIDKSNLETDFLRNKVRNNLLPVVQSIFPGYKGSLIRTINELNSANYLIENMNRELKWEKRGSIWFCDYKVFSSLPPLVKRKQIYNLYNIVYKGVRNDLRIPSNFLNPLDHNLDDYSEIIIEGFGYRLLKKQNYLIFKPTIQKKTYIYVDQYKKFKNSSLDLEVSTENNEGFFFGGVNIPFTIRTPEEGTKDSKKIKKLNISPLDYDNILIIEHKGEVSGVLSPSMVYFNIKNDQGIFLKIGE